MPVKRADIRCLNGRERADHGGGKGVAAMTTKTSISRLILAPLLATVITVAQAGVPAPRHKMVVHKTTASHKTIAARKTTAYRLSYKAPAVKTGPRRAVAARPAPRGRFALQTASARHGRQAARPLHNRFVAIRSPSGRTVSRNPVRTPAPPIATATTSEAPIRVATQVCRKDGRIYLLADCSSLEAGTNMTVVANP